MAILPPGMDKTRFRPVHHSTGLKSSFLLESSAEKPSSSPPIHFGSASAMASLGPVNRGIASMYNWFETSYEPGFILLSKIFGNTIPRVAICRTEDERKDVAFNEITQGATLFVLLPLLSPIANWVQDKLYQGKEITGRHLKMENAKAFNEAKRAGGIRQVRRLKILKLGKAFGVSAVTAAGLMAITYYRNYWTIKRTGFSDYTQIVGLEGNKEPTPAQRAEAEQAAEKNLNIVKGIMGGSAIIALLGMGGAAMLARRANALFKPGGTFNLKKMDEWLNNGVKHWALVGKNNNQINSVFKSTKQTLWVWGVPSYFAWIMACRDKYEVAEQLSKFATFVAGYVGVPKLTAWMRNKLDQSGRINKRALLSAFNEAAQKKKYDMTRVYNQLIHKMGKTHPRVTKDLIRLWNANNMGILALNVFVIGALPIVFNIFFSAWRHQREEAEKQATLKTYTFQHPGGRLYRKNFQNWGLQS